MRHGFHLTHHPHRRQTRQTAVRDAQRQRELQRSRQQMAALATQTRELAATFDNATAELLAAVAALRPLADALALASALSDVPGEEYASASLALARAQNAVGECSIGAVLLARHFTAAGQ